MRNLHPSSELGLGLIDHSLVLSSEAADSDMSCRHRPIVYISGFHFRPVLMANISVTTRAVSCSKTIQVEAWCCVGVVSIES